MPHSLPYWPPEQRSSMPHMLGPLGAFAIHAPARRWVIVDGETRRDVDEAAYRAALGSCDRVEVTRCAHDDVVLHLCYLGPSP